MSAYDAAAVAELIKAARGIAGRVEQASRAIHDSTRWDDESMYSADDNGPTISEWIFADLDAALSKFAEE